MRKTMKNFQIKFHFFSAEKKYNMYVAWGSFRNVRAQAVTTLPNISEKMFNWM